MSNKMEELMEFPVIYTYKAMGENTESFVKDVKNVFESAYIQDFREIKSSKGSYTSVSVTVTVNSFDELQDTYERIKKVNGLKYHL